jgi:hypothetical protein
MSPNQINPQPNPLRAAQYVRMSTEHLDLDKKMDTEFL